MKKILIFVDRDGTLIYDKKCHYGSQKNWKALIKICPGIAQGIKLLRKIPNSKIYMISNQPGVAIKDFPLLTLKRAHEVSKYILNQLKKKNSKIDGYEICQHASPSYVRKHKQFNFNKKLVDNFSCIKPKPGMINQILKKEKIPRKDVKIYVVGDRESDVKTALNVKGFGILVPFRNQSKEKNKVSKIKSKNKYIARNFPDAARFISKREKS